MDDIQDDEIPVGLRPDPYVNAPPPEEPVDPGYNIEGTPSGPTPDVIE